MVFPIFSGDGDSNVAKKLQEAMPYGPAIEITKIECRNHMMRVFCKRLSRAQKNTQFPLQHRKKFGEKVQKSVRRSLGKLINNAVKKGDTSTEAVDLLKKQIHACVTHFAGKHDNCR